MEVLTQSHFLMGDRYRDVARLPDGFAYPYKRRWFHIQDLLDTFWRRFVTNITPHFHRLNKWASDRPELQTGDVVLVLDTDDRARWPLGRVVETHATERDGRIRKVTIKVGKQLILRSAHHVLLLLAMKQNKRAMEEVQQ